MDQIRHFYLLRKEDVSGTSGTGIVARGVILPSGKAVMEWTSFHTSLGVFDRFEDVEKIHGHEGKTEVVVGDPKLVRQKRGKKVRSGEEGN